MAKQTYKILSIVGTRPNFMKVSPIDAKLRNHPFIEHLVLHTGQHYDTNMSDDFFRDLEMRQPDIFLNISGGGLGDQTGRIMSAFEKELRRVKPDLVLVVGDVNSTFACCWVAVQNHVRVAHVESGLRSFDRRMPEEINRICTDVIADLLFTTHQVGDENLKKEGIPSHKIHMVGDIMIDCLVKYRTTAQELRAWQQFKLEPQRYGLLTLHRPSNVDDPTTLERLLDTVSELAQELPLIAPLHPRTRRNLEEFGLLKKFQNRPGLHLAQPLGYLKFLSLMLQARLVLTDSGGLQEETSFLGIPCVTLRENTERPFCISEGTNHLAGCDPATIRRTFAKVMQQPNTGAQKAMPGWDGNTAGRVVKVLEDYLQHH